MAIYNSIALGKAKGSIGNLTLSVLNTQAIVKAKKEKTGKIIPGFYSSANYRLLNAVKLYQLMALYLSNFYADKKRPESRANLFIRLIISFMPTIQVDSIATIFSYLSNNFLSHSRFFGYFMPNYDVGEILIQHNMANQQYIPLSTCRVFFLDSVTTLWSYVEHVITEAEWNNNSFLVDLGTDTATDSSIYIYCLKGKLSSPIYFTSI